MQIDILIDERKLEQLEPKSVEVWSAINQIPSARVIFSKPEEARIKHAQQASDIARFTKGAMVEIWVRDGNTPSLLFKGIVTADRYHGRPGEVHEFAFKARHVLQRLVDSHRSQIFDYQTDAEIVNNLLHDGDVNVGEVERLAVRHRQMVQSNCSDWHFLKTRLGAYPVWMIATPEKVDIVKAESAGQAHHTVKLKRDARDDVVPLEFEFIRNYQEQPDELVASSWDFKTQEMVRKESKRKQVPGEGANRGALGHADKPWVLTRSALHAPDELTELADARLQERRTLEKWVRFVVPGAAGYQPGQPLRTAGFGAPHDGSGWITEVRHDLVAGIWRTTVWLGQETALPIDAPVVPQVSGVAIGVVAAYGEGDPDQLGRLPVKVPALSQDDKPIWARFASPYASKGSGLCLYPEVGDEVVLGYVDGDPRSAIILSSMYSPERQAPIEPSAENARKALVLTNGDFTQSIEFDIQAKATKVVNGDDSVMLQEGILGKSSKHVRVEADEVSVDLQADAGSVSVKAQDVSLTADNALHMNGNQTELKGAANVTIKGAAVDLTS